MAAAHGKPVDAEILDIEAALTTLDSALSALRSALVIVTGELADGGEPFTMPNYRRADSNCRRPSTRPPVPATRCSAGWSSAAALGNEAARPSTGRGKSASRQVRPGPAGYFSLTSNYSTIGAMDSVTRSPRRLPHLLKGRGRAVLREVAAGRTLLAFDFDGTLAPIADRPQGAALTARMRSLLAALARRYPCAVISGRARNDVRGRLGRIPLFALAGSHGAEVADSPTREPRARVRSWASDLQRRLHRLHGVALEVKPHGVAVHYRAVADKREAQAVIFSALRGLQHARHIHGKDVVEVLPIGAPTKGDALRAFRARVKPRFTVYVGDDVTDEDAFSSAGHGSLLPVRVGGGRATSALFRLDAQHEVEELLSVLILLAPKPGTWLNDSLPDRVQ